METFKYIAIEERFGVTIIFTSDKELPKMYRRNCKIIRNATLSINPIGYVEVIGMKIDFFFNFRERIYDMSEANEFEQDEFVIKEARIFSNLYKKKKYKFPINTFIKYTEKFDKQVSMKVSNYKIIKL